jgi:hypothetical protein
MKKSTQCAFFLKKSSLYIAIIIMSRNQNLVMAGSAAATINEGTTNHY